MQHLTTRLTALARLSTAVASHHQHHLLAAVLPAASSAVLALQQNVQHYRSLHTLHRSVAAFNPHQQQQLQQWILQAVNQQQQQQLQWRALQRTQQLQQNRPYSSNDDAAKRRLLQAQQRREREQQLQKLKLEREQQARHEQQLQGQLAEAQAAPGHPVDAVAVAPTTAPPSEVQVQDVVGHSALIVTRAIEWGTLILGFEQATKYTVYDQDGAVVALIAEEVSGIGNEIQRQLLRTRRSFTSTVLSADGSQVVFRVRRPAYLINSYMYIENPQGEVIGEVRQRWHLWRRNYDLFIGKRQFAAINGGFLAWEFELKDAQANTLALIDRNFLGFAKEIFTDAGKYVVHFGYKPQQAAELCTRTIQARSGQADVAVTPLAQVRTEVAVIPSITGNQLVVQHPLPLSERLIALAAAISVDYNYFSPHSNSGGLINPPLFMPVPMPGGGGGGAAAADGEAAAAATSGPEAAAGAPPSGSSSSTYNNDDAGFSSGLGSDTTPSPGGGFADDAESFRWDTGSSSSSSSGGGSEGWGGLGGGEGGDEDSAGGLWGVLVGIWAMIFGE